MSNISVTPENENKEYFMTTMIRTLITASFTILVLNPGIHLVSGLSKIMLNAPETSAEEAHQLAATNCNGGGANLCLNRSV